MTANEYHKRSVTPECTSSPLDESRTERKNNSGSDRLFDSAPLAGEGISLAVNSTLPSDNPLPPAKYTCMTEFTEEFWKEKKQKMMEVREADMLNKTKNMSVPMARVKKIMRIDDDVRNFMIASDAPIFMAQAAEFFIEEMTGMGWQFVSESRRRILQKADIGTAVQKSDQFDFLIDFLPSKNKNHQACSSLNTPSEQIFEGPPYADEAEKPGNSIGTTTKRNLQIKKTINSHSDTNGRFRCVLNETPRGNEYQIVEMNAPNNVVPTSSLHFSENTSGIRSTGSAITTSQGNKFGTAINPRNKHK